MAYLTTENGKKQHPSNHENHRQARNPAPPESKEQNSIHPVEQADNKASHLPTKHSSHDAPCSSTTLQKRDIKIQQGFERLIHPSTFQKVEKDASGWKKYNGIYHSQYSLSVRNFTEYNQKKPLDTKQLSQLLPLLKNYFPKSDWIWRNLSTPLHSWTTAGLFAPNKELCREAQKTQEHLLNAFLTQVLARHTTDRRLPDLCAISLSTLLNSLTNLMDKGLPLETPNLKKAVIILLEHVKTIDESPSDCLMEQAILNLLWSTVTLEKKGLKPEETPALKSSVAILWKNATELDNPTCHGLGNLIRCIVPLVECKLFKDTQKLNQSLTSLLLIVDKQKQHLHLQDISYLLWSIGELGEYAHLLNVENTQKIQDIVLSPAKKIKTALKLTKYDDIDVAQCTISTLRVITTLVKSGLLEGLSEDQSKLSQSLAMLYCLTNEMKHLLPPKELTSMMIVIAKLGEYKLTQENTELFKNTAVALLPFVTSTAKSAGFSLLEIINTLHSITSLVDSRLLKVTSMISQSVAALLPFIAKDETTYLVRRLEAVSKLCESEIVLENKPHLKAATLTLLPIFEAAAPYLTSLQAHEIVNMLCSVVKLMDSSLKLNTQKFEPLVTLLLPLVAEQMNNFATISLNHLLWAMAKLMKFVLNLKHSLDFQFVVASLLSIVATKVESKEEKKSLVVPLILWNIATLVSQELPLNTPDLKKIVVKLLFHIDVLDEGFIPRQIANTLWAVAFLGELIEINVAVTLSASLIEIINTYDQFTQPEKMMSLWGMVACITRAQLFSSDCSNECAILQAHIQQLFNLIKNSTLELEMDKRTMALVSAWLGEPCCIAPVYNITTSKYQSALLKALTETYPSLSIVKEKVIGVLPPVDLYLPDHNIVIEIQGPSHYIGADLQTRNGSTLLKIALLKKLRYDVIELTLCKEVHAISIKKNIYKIQERIQIAEAPLDDQYFTAEETLNSSDTDSLKATERSTKTEQQPTEVITRKKKRKKKKDRRNKTPQSLLPHSL